jgi:hypothetical protein
MVRKKRFLDQESQPEAEELSAQELMVVGWLPSRDEFEVEHNNEAETLVSGLEIGKYEDGDDEVTEVRRAVLSSLYRTHSRTGARARTHTTDAHDTPSDTHTHTHSDYLFRSCFISKNRLSVRHLSYKHSY